MHSCVARLNSHILFLLKKNIVFFYGRHRGSSSSGGMVIVIGIISTRIRFVHQTEPRAPSLILLLYIHIHFIYKNAFSISLYFSIISCVWYARVEYVDKSNFDSAHEVENVEWNIIPRTALQTAQRTSIFIKYFIPAYVVCVCVFDGSYFYAGRFLFI